MWISLARADGAGRRISPTLQTADFAARSECFPQRGSGRVIAAHAVNPSAGRSR